MKKAFVLLPILLYVFTPAHSQPGRSSTLSVLNFISNEIPAVQTAMLSDAFANDIRVTGAFDVIDRSKQNDILSEKGFSQKGNCNEASCLIEAGKILSVDKIVGGRVSKRGEVWFLSIELIDVASGQSDKVVTKYYKGVYEQIFLNLRDIAGEIALTSGINPKDVKSRLNKQRKQIYIGNFRGTRMFCPIATYATLTAGSALTVMAIYYKHTTSKAYDDYLAAISDDEILLFKEKADDNNKLAGKIGYGAAACIGMTAISALIRVRTKAKPAYGEIPHANLMPLAWLDHDGCRIAFGMMVRF